MISVPLLNAFKCTFGLNAHGFLVRRHRKCLQQSAGAGGVVGLGSHVFCTGFSSSPKCFGSLLLALGQETGFALCDPLGAALSNEEQEYLAEGFLSQSFDSRFLFLTTGRCQNAVGIRAAPRSAERQRLLPWGSQHSCPALLGERRLSLTAHQCCGGFLYPDKVGTEKS